MDGSAHSLHPNGSLKESPKSAPDTEEADWFGPIPGSFEGPLVCRDQTQAQQKSVLLMMITEVKRSNE